MSEADKFSIESTSEGGDQEGLLSIRRVGRGGSGVLAYVIPRYSYFDKQNAVYTDFHKELERSGIYILWEPASWAERSRIYVGKSEKRKGSKGVLNRLSQHHSKKETFWKMAVVFTDRCCQEFLNGTQIDYLEASFIRKANDVNRSEVTNKQVPQYPQNIEPRDEQDAFAFFEEAIAFLPFIGIDAFVISGPSIEDTDLLFKFVCQQISWLDRKHIELPEPPYTSPITCQAVISRGKQVVASKEFAEVEQQSDRLEITLKISGAQLHDPLGKLQSSSTGVAKVNMRSLDELPDIMSLVRQAFERIAAELTAELDVQPAPPPPESREAIPQDDDKAGTTISDQGSGGQPAVPEQDEQDSRIYTLVGESWTNEKWDAKGYPVPHPSGRPHNRAFVVKEGSLARRRPSEKLEAGNHAWRRKLKDNGTLKEEGNEYLRFTKDHTFNSPSQAAAIVTGRQSSGWQLWKSEEGTLDELERVTPDDDASVWRQVRLYD